MKQRVMVKELEKLTDAQKEKLREWWKSELGDFYIFKYEGVYWAEPYMIDQMEGYQKYMNENGEDPVPLLSVGQMIAFIQDKKPLLKGISKNRFNKWFVNIENGMLGYKDELCDALWESIQQILKQP